MSPDEQTRRLDRATVDWQRLAAETVFTNYDDEDEFRRVLREATLLHL